MTYRKHYSADEAAAYESGKAGNTRRDQREQALVRRAMLQVPRGTEVLDLPCGAGRMTSLWAAEGYRVRAADVSPAMLARTRQRMQDEGRQVPTALQDLERLSLGDRSIDTVFCFRVFHHLPDEAVRETVLGELCRVAERRLLLSYLDARAWSSVRRRLLHRGPERRHAQRPRHMEQALARHGFQVLADLAERPWLHSLRLLVAERRDGPAPSRARPDGP